MKMYRAGYWTDGQHELVLTGPEHSGMTDEEIEAEARDEAERQGMDLSTGRIEVGEWVER